VIRLPRPVSGLFDPDVGNALSASIDAGGYDAWFVGRLRRWQGIFNGSEPALVAHEAVPPQIKCEGTTRSNMPCSAWRPSLETPDAQHPGGTENELVR
jgi:hypothetical protein